MNAGTCRFWQGISGHGEGARARRTCVTGLCVLATPSESLRMLIRKRIPGTPEHPVDVVEKTAALNEWAFDRADDDEISILVAGKWAHYESPSPGCRRLKSLHVSCSFDIEVPALKRIEVLSSCR